MKIDPSKYVRWVPSGRWAARAPAVNGRKGDVLGTFDFRSQALSAVARWLKEHRDELAGERGAA